eukprot:162198-Hanusia_phi.AAC.2
MQEASGLGHLTSVGSLLRKLGGVPIDFGVGAVDVAVAVSGKGRVAHVAEGEVAVLKVLALHRAVLGA